MDKYSHWLICWSRTIFILQHLPLSSPKKKQLFLGSPPTKHLKYPCGEHPFGSRGHLKQFAVCFSRNPLGESGFRIQIIFKVRVFWKRKGCADLLFHIQTVWCLSLTLRNLSCNGLIGTDDPHDDSSQGKEALFRSNQKTSLRIMDFYWEWVKFTFQFKAANSRQISWLWLRMTLKSSQMERVYNSEARDCV